MIFWICVLTLLESVQAVLLLNWALGFLPLTSPMAAIVYPEWRYMFRPEWEMVLLRFFIFFAVVFHCFALWCWQCRFGGGDKALPRLKQFICVEAILLFLMLSAAFKMAVYPQRPQLAGGVFNVLLAAALANKFFWPHIHRIGTQIKDFILNPQRAVFLSRLLGWTMPGVIFLVINVPYLPAVIARFFVGEQFHHNDSFIYGPSLAYLNGCVPDVDVISQYGVGVGVLFGNIMQWMGGFSYEHGLLAMIYGVIIYYILCFVFLRQWLESSVLAAVGILYAIKVQMFNTGVYPFVFTYGSATVMRFWFDIFFLLAIAAHLRNPSRWFLVVAATACGAQLFYIPSDGLYLVGAYLTYIFLNLCRRQWRVHIGFSLDRILLWLTLMLLPFLVAFALMYFFIGPAVLSQVFWHNMGEFIEYFLSGFGVTPIYSSLQDRQYLASLMGFIVPAVYVLTMMMVGTLLFLDKIHRRHILVVVICVYGLGLYHYYVARSAVTSYYVVAIPYVMILCFWIKVVLNRLSNALRLKVKWALLALTVWALWTNHNFLSYPNILNFSHNPMTDTLVAQPLSNGRPYFNHLFRDYAEQFKVGKNSLGEADEKFVAESNFESDDDLVGYYNNEGDFSIDAALIDRLTMPGQRVALVSSFEIKILMQAKRRPYFYYFPLVISHPMRARNLVRISVYTDDQLSKLLTGLETDKPEYVFVEKILLTRPLPQYFYYEYSALMYLTDYILTRYAPVEQGQYLTAMRRK